MYREANQVHARGRAWTETLKLAASFKFPKRTERKDDKMLYSTEENCRMESGLS